MATIDVSRHATEFRKHYAGVRMQQGRVLTDDDFNEAARLDQEDTRRTRIDVVGPTGSPDGGFKIGSLTTAGGVGNFTIGAGTLYLGGLRLEMHQPETYRLQRDWIRQPTSADIALPALGTTRYDLAWIEGWQQPVSAVEDSELFEIALSGPDTSARVRTMRRVLVEPNVGNKGCLPAWSALVASWAAAGTLTPELELVTDATLTVTFDVGGGAPNLCSPPVAGGYLGAENQAIRVQLVDATHFTWGFDNAAPLYRVKVETDNANKRRVIKMLSEPKDQAHWPLAGQVVELLPWSAVVANRVLPNGNLQDPEKLAELGGWLARVDGSYNPDTQAFTIALANEVPAAFGEEWQNRSDAGTISAPADQYLFLRVWNRGADAASPLAIPFVANAPVALSGTGLLVTLQGTQFRPTDFWVIAARPESPNRVVPWQLEVRRPPHGYRRFRAPLAVIRWQNQGGVVTGEVVSDCRETFLPLTKIGTCCTYTVGDGNTSHGHFTSIQAAINNLPPDGGEVCVLPGLFTENVVLQARQNVTLHGCGARSRIQAPAPGGNNPAAPVIRITDCTDIRVRDLALIADPTAPGVLVAPTPPSGQLTFAGLDVKAGPRSALEVQGGTAVSITGCAIRMNDSPGPWAAIFSVADDMLVERNTIEVVGTPGQGGPVVQAGRGGLQLGGGSERVRVVDNLIRGGIGNGITLGTIEQVGGGGNVTLEVWVVDADDPCSPCKPGDVVIVTGGGGGGAPTYRSAGDLYDITIERNRIHDMGLNGIGVVGFFDPQDKELISVHDLTIAANEIEHCLKRPLALVPVAMVDAMGYGGVALADCEHLVVRDNVIADNGPNHLEPVCGVYVLRAEGADVSNNRILNNGARTDQPATSARPGARAGIHIQHAVTPVLAPLGKQGLFRPRGVPAARIHENVVTHPLGRALALEALGLVSVQDNRLVSQGFVPGSVSALATTVAILDLGVTNEFPVRHALDLLSGFGQGGGKLSIPCADATVTKPGDVPLAAVFPSGKVLFSGNQCTLDLRDAGASFALSSVAIVSLDDVGFHDNQCECDLFDQFVLVPTILLAMTVRMSDNRLSEGWVNSWWSASTTGVLNATTNNQSTHCLLVSAMRNDLEVNTGNVAVLEAFCPNLCRRSA